MAYQPNNPNGQTTMANSSPVVIASDQSALPVSDNGSSLTVDGSVTVSGTVTANAGTGTMNVSVQNASIPVTDNGGSLTVDGSVSVSNFPATQPVSGTVTVQDGGGSLTIDGSVSVSNFPATQNVSVTNASIPITDNGGSLTIDGSVSVSNFPATQAVSGTVTIQDGGNTITVDGTIAATQSGTWDVRTQDGVGNDITSHSAGASRGIDVSIIDGSGNQITSFGGGTQYADGAATATPTGTVALGFDGTNVQALSTDANGVLDVTIGNASIPVTDNGGSLTIDGTVTATQTGGSTYNVQISDGTSTVPIDAAHADGETNTENHIDIGAKTLVFNGTSWDRQRGDTTGTFMVGNIAHDTADSGNPVKIGFQAEGSTLPTAVASGDRVNGIADLFGRQLVGVIDASMQVWKSANYTTQQTGASIWTPSTGKKICITYLSVASYATTTGRVLIWFGASGDTTYTAGTDQLVWGGSFAPSANAKPGAIIQLPFGITAVNADYQLRVTTDAAISLDITVYGYEC